VEHLLHDAQVGEGLVVQARDQQRLLRPHRAAEPGHAEQVGAEQDAVVARAVRLQVVGEGLAVDAVRDPGALVGVGDGQPLVDQVLHAQEVGYVAVRIDREEAHGHPVHLPRAGRDGVLPRKVVGGAGGQELDLPARPRAALGQRLEQRLRAAHGGALGEAGRDESDALGDGHGRD
jgi:hypothetical protein